MHPSVEFSRPDASGWAARLRSGLGALVPAGAGAAVLLASLVNFLDYNDYPLLRPEIGLVAALLVALALAVGLVHASLGSLPRVVLDILLAYLAFDLNFDGIVVPIAALTAAIVLNRFVVPVLGIVFTVVLATGLAASAIGGGTGHAAPAPVPAGAADRPPLLHLVLDEHIGVAGLPQDMPSAASIRGELRDFYADRGFRLFEGAYSEHMRTVNSLPHILNFGKADAAEKDRHKNAATRTNAYFERLQELGYSIRVYQNDYVDLCATAAVGSCIENRASDIGPVAGTTLPTADKAVLVLHGLAGLSDAAKIAMSFYDDMVLAAHERGVELPLLLRLQKNSSLLGALSAMDRLTADLAHARPGDAFFAHVLLPHYPYATDADCSVKRVAEWQGRRSPVVSWEDRQDAYFDQIRCALAKFDAALTALGSSAGGNGAIVVVHGDHRSRITETDPLAAKIEHVSERDLIGTFSTLFAVKAPGIEPQTDDTRLPVARLLAAFAKSAFRSTKVDVPPDFHPSVTLDDSSWTPVRRHDLPSSWATP